MSGMSFFQEAKKNTHGRHWAVLFVLTTLLIYYPSVSEEKGLFLLLLLIEKITVGETHTQVYDKNNRKNRLL